MMKSCPLSVIGCPRLQQRAKALSAIAAGPAWGPAALECGDMSPLWARRTCPPRGGASLECGDMSPLWARRSVRRSAERLWSAVTCHRFGRGGLVRRSAERPWSAVTCHRFGPGRSVLGVSNVIAQAPTLPSPRLLNWKAVTCHRTPKSRAQPVAQGSSTGKR